MSPHVEAIADEFTRYKALGEAAIAQLGDEELVATASDGGKSIVAIVWHLAGNLESRFTDFRTTDGEKPWRDRDDEFVLRTVTRSELLEKWEIILAPRLDAEFGVSNCASIRHCNDPSHTPPITSARSCSWPSRFEAGAGDV